VEEGSVLVSRHVVLLSYCRRINFGRFLSSCISTADLTENTRTYYKAFFVLLSLYSIGMLLKDPSNHWFISRRYQWALIPVAARNKARVFGHSLHGIVISNPAWGMDVSLLGLLCVVR
jgi:hypothetical protein